MERVIALVMCFCVHRHRSETEHLAVQKICVNDVRRTYCALYQQQFSSAPPPLRNVSKYFAIGANVCYYLLSCNILVHVTVILIL